jgi:hypothetical protein
MMSIELPLREPVDTEILGNALDFLDDAELPVCVRHCFVSW